jgi:hypothetical protein
MSGHRRNITIHCRTSWCPRTGHGQSHAAHRRKGAPMSTSSIARHAGPTERHTPPPAGVDDLEAQGDPAPPWTWPYPPPRAAPPTPAAPSAAPILRATPRRLPAPWPSHLRRQHHLHCHTPPALPVRKHNARASRVLVCIPRLRARARIRLIEYVSFALH